MRIKIMNAYAIALSVCALIVSSLLLSLKISTMGWLASGVGLIFWVSILMNALEKPQLARALLILNFNVAIYVYSVSLGRDSGTHFWFITAGMMAFAIYDLSEIQYLISSLALSFIGLFFTWISKFQYSPLPILNLESHALILISSTMVTLASFTALSIVYYVARELHQKVAQLKLHSHRVTQNHLNALNAAGIVAHTDTSGKITYANENFCKISEYSKEELLSQTHSFIQADQHPPSFINEIWDTISSKAIWKGEICNKTKSGNFYWVDTTIVPILNSQDNIEEYVAISHDITAKKNAESMLVHNSKLASLGEMSAGIAHEINNPVAIILGTIRTIPRFASDLKKLTEKVQAIEKAANRIAKIVSGLKKFSRSSDKSDFRTLSLNALIAETLTLTATNSQRHLVPIKVGLRAEVLIYCNEVEIEQVLINLINNGIDAVKDLPDKWLQISLFEHNETVILQIRDSGRGIPLEVKNKLYQPFFTTKPVGQGTGLGLSIVKGILDQHGATISVLEKDPHTCFEIRFPKAEGVKNAA